ncbi:hypothetical protein AgCh_038270 [Apium graveolens]
MAAASSSSSVQTISDRNPEKVAGYNLKEVLNSGVRSEIDKAMLLLVQRASAGAVDAASRPGNIPYEHGEKVVEDTKRVVAVIAPTGVNPRKRHRRKMDQGDVDGAHETADGISKTSTLVENCILMANIVEPQARQEAVRVEIQPMERWTGGLTVPLCAFKIFNLPQHSVAYEGRRRNEIVDRCKDRADGLLLIFCTSWRSLKPTDVLEKKLEDWLEAARNKGEEIRISGQKAGAPAL